jgi:hypothetical protein
LNLLGSPSIPLVANRFRDDDPPRTIDGGFHTIMVFAAPLESNEMPPWLRAADQGFQEEIPRGMSRRFRSGATLETDPVADAQGFYSVVEQPSMITLPPT